RRPRYRFGFSFVLGSMGMLLLSLDFTSDSARSGTGSRRCRGGRGGTGEGGDIFRFGRGVELDDGDNVSVGRPRRRRRGGCRVGVGLPGHRSPVSLWAGLCVSLSASLSVCLASRQRTQKKMKGKL